MPGKPLRPEGLDIFYIDESVGNGHFISTAVRIPFLRPSDPGWSIVWEDHLDKAEAWRRALSKNHHIKFREELHAHKLLKSAGCYHKSGRNLSHSEAFNVYKDALATLTFLDPGSILTTHATTRSSLYGTQGFEAGIVTLLQRMRSQCDAENRNGMVFFDEGHDEYINMYRRAVRHLQTGSAHGIWGHGGASKNIPLAMFTKDANIKRSHYSYFIQAADLVAYSALQKVKQEVGILNAKRVQRLHHTLYDAIPKASINLAVTRRRQDGIAPI
jgi:hypothetical protein